MSIQRIISNINDQIEEELRILLLLQNSKQLLAPKAGAMYARDGKMMSKHVSLDYSIQNVKIAIVIIV